MVWSSNGKLINCQTATKKSGLRSGTLRVPSNSSQSQPRITDLRWGPSSSTISPIYSLSWICHHGWRRSENTQTRMLKFAWSPIKKIWVEPQWAAPGCSMTLSKTPREKKMNNVVNAEKRILDRRRTHQLCLKIYNMSMKEEIVTIIEEDKEAQQLKWTKVYHKELPNSGLLVNHRIISMKTQRLASRERQSVRLNLCWTTLQMWIQNQT